MRTAALSLVLILASLTPLAVAARQTGLFEQEKSRLTQKWTNYTHEREKRALELRACREQATVEHVAQTKRAEFVHRCVKAR
jgi:hypothetical protein